MDLLRPRLISLYIFLFCALVLGIALYMEHGMLLEPCPLCIMQRVFFLAVGLVGLLAFIHNPAGKGLRIYGWTGAFLAFAGSGFALRQIWLQHLPKDQVPSCGPSLSYMLQEFPFSEVLELMFSGDASCAEVLWVDPVLGLGIPQWSLVGFIGLAAACIYQALRRPMR
ncbi:MAG: disulfide bond formation protein B [Pseudomonadales bacterium]|nr:disulfide bond formation protein B [Pseudomonadales bacterium]